MNAAILRAAGQSLAHAILTLLAADTIAAQTTKPITVDDLLALKTLADAQLSPDGQLVAFTVSAASLADNRNSAKMRRAVSHTNSPRCPRTSPISHGRRRTTLPTGPRRC